MKKLGSVFLFASIMVASAVAAQEESPISGTPDGEPPSVETVCEGESGAAFGLCNAYCEAMDCELANDEDPYTQPSASSTACGKVRNKYMQLTGEDLPCEVSCPCIGAGYSTWDAFVGGACQFYTDAVGSAPCVTGCATAGGALWATPTACAVWDNTSGCTGPITWCGEYSGGWTMVEVSQEQAQHCDAVLRQVCPVQ